MTTTHTCHQCDHAEINTKWRHGIKCGDWCKCHHVTARRKEDGSQFTWIANDRFTRAQEPVACESFKPLPELETTP